MAFFWAKLGAALAEVTAAEDALELAKLAPFECCVDTDAGPAALTPPPTMRTAAKPLNTIRTVTRIPIPIVMPVTRFPYESDLMASALFMFPFTLLLKAKLVRDKEHTIKTLPPYRRLSR